MFSKLLLLACIFLPTLAAEPDGAAPRLAGAPGDDTCTSCHQGTALNAGGGRVTILLDGPATYEPGVKQRIRVQVDDPVMRAAGFELTARLASDLAHGQAGTLLAPDNKSQVICENVLLPPCASNAPVQFITHTYAGYAATKAASNTFDVDWVPPATNVGSVRLYATANAANGNGRNTGDHIYSTSLELAPVGGMVPQISSVVNGASFGDTGITWRRIPGPGPRRNSHPARCRMRWTEPV
jgi:hypothetical protein